MSFRVVYDREGIPRGSFELGASEGVKTDEIFLEEYKQLTQEEEKIEKHSDKDSNSVVEIKIYKNDRNVIKLSIEL